MNIATGCLRCTENAFEYCPLYSPRVERVSDKARLTSKPTMLPKLGGEVIIDFFVVS